MHKRIIGNPTTTPMAIPDFNQTNPLKADYIKNKPDFHGLEEKVNTNTNNIASLEENKVDNSTLDTYYLILNTQINNVEALALQTKEFVRALPIKTIPTTLEPNQQYNFGEVTELALAFPTVANDGDVIYATFITGETVTTLTIDTTNTCDIEFVPEANTGYEIFGKYNGSIWIVNYSEYTVSEG